MLVKTKLYIPHLRSGLLSRPKLAHKLNEGMRHKLTLVSAQAGYGKTTALSEWAHQSDGLVAWLSLDKLDNDWIQFWTYVAASIQEKISGFGAALPSIIEGGSSQGEHAVKVLLNELNQLTDELTLILDDYHVIEQPEIHHSITYLLEHLPRHIHLYISSRTDVDIPTAKLMVRGEIQHILIQDLRIERDEVQDFFRNSIGLLLISEQVAELYDQTEGWIGALQLAAISLQHSNDIVESIHQFRGHHHQISSYLLEEVFYQQSEPIQRFLLETSVLSRMNYSLCQAVTGQMNSQEQLERLEHLNLFIMRLDDGRNWYRYHHLLSDFLQQRLFRNDPDKWRQAHIRAAGWYEEQGEDEMAVEHFVEGRQPRDAIRLIEKNLHFFMKSKEGALKRWVTALPPSSYADKPLIEMLYISSMPISGNGEDFFQRVYQVKDRFEAERTELPDEAWKKVIGPIYFYCAIAAILQKDYSHASEYLELAEHYVPDTSFFKTMLVNRYQGYGTFNDITSYYEPRSAAPFFLKWIQSLKSKRHFSFVAFKYVIYSEFLYEWNQLDEALYYISQVMENNQDQPFALVFHIAVTASRIYQARGDSDAATDLLMRVKSGMNETDYEVFMPKIEAELVYLYLRQGLLQYGLEWLQTNSHSHTDEISLMLMAEHMVAARILAAIERYDEALYLLDRMYSRLTEAGRLREQIKVLIVQSIVRWRSGQTDAALEQLESALKLAEPEGYICSFMDEGPVMPEMLSSCLKARPDSRTSPSIVYVKQLLQAMNVSMDKERSPKELLTEQESKIILLIADGLLNKEIAHRLNIKVETVKFHIKNMYRKLEVNNRVQALQRAKQLQILVE